VRPSTAPKAKSSHRKRKEGGWEEEKGNGGRSLKKVSKKVESDVKNERPRNKKLKEMSGKERLEKTKVTKGEKEKDREQQNREKGEWN